jgi:hypothetical protein
MFSDPDEIDTKITCYGVIKKPLGPRKCLLHRRVNDFETYEFNLFYKYLCMYVEGAIIDIEPSYCLDQEWMDLRMFNKIEDCLKSYETSGLTPQLTQERSQFYYIRGEQEEDVNLERILDRDSEQSTPVALRPLLES